MCQCEDRPCCGHLAEERADDRYNAEREYYGEGRYSDADCADEEDEYCDDCNETAEDCYCGGGEYYGREDSALESSLCGDC